MLVTGSSLTAEERDRPLAYLLKAEIDRRGAGHAYRRAVVVGDVWYLENRIFHLNPTIAIGGPGANGVAREFGALPSDDLQSGRSRCSCRPISKGELKRATLWGANAAATAAAVEVFTTQGHLDDLLGRIWRFRVGDVRLTPRVRELEPEQVRQRAVHHFRRLTVDDPSQHVHRLERQALGVHPVALVAHDVAQRDRRDRGLVARPRSSVLRTDSTS